MANHTSSRVDVAISTQQLTRFIRQRRLTDSLQLLEASGFHGESAIALLSFFAWEVL
jgi:hypothetical protein